MTILALYSASAFAEVPACLETLANNLGTKKFTEQEINCLDLEPNFRRAMNLLCIQDRSTITVSYSRYLYYKTEWTSVRNKLASAASEEESRQLRVQLAGSEAAWQKMGFKNEIELIFLSLWTVRSRCERTQKP